jgi:hypothetical protein
MRGYALTGLDLFEWLPGAPLAGLAPPRAGTYGAYSPGLVQRDYDIPEF